MTTNDPHQINGVHNPFNKPDNDELTFLGRKLENGGNLQAVKYRPENSELYGPLWIFVTLIVEFVILGHLSNQLNIKSSDSQELFNILSAKAAD